MWIAICPKCETFTVIDGYYSTYCCAHFQFGNKMILPKIDTAYTEPSYEKIQCKVINQDDFMRKP